MKGTDFSRSHSPPVVRLLLIVAIMLLIQGAGWADEVAFQVSTQGTFGAGVPDCNPSLEGALTYGCISNVALTVDSDDPSGTVYQVNLGSFRLTGASAFALTTFALTLQFVPPAVGPNPTQGVFLSVNPTGGGAAIYPTELPPQFNFGTVGSGQWGSFRCFLNPSRSQRTSGLLS